MSNFIEKVGEKLHIGGQKKEGEPELPPQQYAFEGQHPPHAGDDHKDHGQLRHGYAEPHGSHPDPVYGGEHRHPEAGHAAFGGVHEQHAGEQHGIGVHEQQYEEQHDTGVPPPQHEGVLEKVKNKIKGQKHDDKDDSSSSSSSDESDGDGGRRRKQKHGIF